MLISMKVSFHSSISDRYRYSASFMGVSYLPNKCRTISIMSLVATFAVVTLSWFVFVGSFSDALFISAMFARFLWMTATTHVAKFLAFVASNDSYALLCKRTRRVYKKEHPRLCRLMWPCHTAVLKETRVCKAVLSGLTNRVAFTPRKLLSICCSISSLSSSWVLF